MFLNKMLVIRTGIHKMFVQKATWEDHDQTASSSAVSRSSLIWVCTVCLSLSDRKLVLKILEHIRYLLQQGQAGPLCADPEGGQSNQMPPPPLKNHKNIGFLSNTGPDPLKNHKATKPAFNVGPHQHTRETPFKWRFTGGPMATHL